MEAFVYCWTDNYQSEEYKKKMKAGWEKRRAKKEKEGLVNGD